MKILMTLLTSILILSACENNSDEVSLPQADKIISSSSPTEEGPQSKGVCMACHQLNASTAGPSIKDISTKHKNTDIRVLVATVKAGRLNELTWGSKPMPPSFLPEEDIKIIIEWMLKQ